MPSNLIKLDLQAFYYLSKRQFWLALWKEISSDDCWGMAARLSFYFLLAFFPFLIFLSAIIGFIPIEPGFLDRILVEMNQFLPERTYAWVHTFTLDLISSQNRGVVSLGILLALWWASVGFSGMVGDLNRALAIKETRSYVKIRLLAIGVTILVSLFVITSGILLFFGDWLIQLSIRHITVQPYPSFQDHLATLYTATRWVLIFAFLNVGMQIVYSALPARPLPWTLLSPGSAIFSLCWILGSIGFAFFVNRFVDYGIYQKLYGSLGTLILLMIWLYLSSFFLLIGGKVNGQVYRFRKEFEIQAAQLSLI
jgi:membrane protein